MKTTSTCLPHSDDCPFLFIVVITPPSSFAESEARAHRKRVLSLAPLTPSHGRSIPAEWLRPLKEGGRLGRKTTPQEQRLEGFGCASCGSLPFKRDTVVLSEPSTFRK
ncbi:hypothetical protein TNCV_2654531 [Trichonephila clavipes]|nr:hypothetical protein TNCV_2654531 [Trichonephila clavipes]